MTRAIPGVPVLLLAIAYLTGCGPELSDTGYEGTWSKGNDRVRSTFSIVRHDENYLVRWGLESSDGQRSVRCDWSGACEEVVDGERVSTFQMRSWIEPATGRLRVEKRGEYLRGPVGSSRYVDELSVRDKGLTLIVRTLQSGEQEFQKRARPKRTFTKVSNDVIDPPQRAGGNPS